MPVPRCSQGAAKLPGSGMAAAYYAPLECHTAEVPLAPDTKGHKRCATEDANVQANIRK